MLSGFFVFSNFLKLKRKIMERQTEDTKGIKKGGKIGCIIGAIIIFLILFFFFAYSYWW